MPTLQDYAILATAIIALGSLGLSLVNYLDAKRTEETKLLLGEKEAVAYVALKVLSKNGSPRGFLFSTRSYRKFVFAALVQACLFERSDRVRAILYQVFKESRETYKGEIDEAIQLMKKALTNARDYKTGRYNFSKLQLDEDDVIDGLERLMAVECILDECRTPCQPSRTSVASN